MAKEFPTRFARALPTTTAAHYKLVAAVVEEGPADLIIGVADGIDLQYRADHLKTILEAVVAYAKAIVADTVHNGVVLIHDETNLLCDAASDVTGALRNAADRMIETEAA